MYVVDVINDVDASWQPSVARYLARVTSKHVYENKGKMCAYKSRLGKPCWDAADRPTDPPTHDYRLDCWSGLHRSKMFIP